MRGSIAKKGASYYIVVDLGRDPTTGKRRQKWHKVTDGTGPRGAVLKRDAERARTEILGRLDHGVYVAPARQSLAEFVESDWLPALQLRDSTKLSYSRNLRLHVLPTLGAVPLQSLDAGQLNRLYASLLAGGRRDTKEGGLSLRSVRYIHTIVHRVLRDAVRWNRLVRNVADVAEPPRARDAEEGSPEMSTWEADELGRFLVWVEPNRYGPAFLFLATTGVRLGEALGLRWSSVDLDECRVSIRETHIAVAHRAVAGRTKTGKPRVIELDPGTVAALRSQRARQAQDRLLLGAGYQDGSYVFAHPDGRPFHPERFSREFGRKQATYNRLHPDAPLPRIRTHDLRHTWATLALRAGVDVKVVSERLGHGSTVITQNIYQHVTRPMATDAAERVARLIFGG